MADRAAIFGLSGHALTPDETAFFREADPLGYILFARNVDTPDQLKALVDSLFDLAGRRDVPILIDQEGGRVQRLRPPHWRSAPPARRFGDLYQRDKQKGREALRLNTQLIAAELADLGINTDCAPLIDLPVPGAHDIIGDRAFANDAGTVIDLGRLQAETFLESGILPVIKHIPGHGRAMADSHLELPSVSSSVEELGASDFKPFTALSDMPLAMTAHVIFSALDPDNPATTSRKVIEKVIRTEMGFSGLLMSDDLSMKALDGDFGARTRAVLDAGCDIVLHCNGDMDEMTAVAAACDSLSSAAADRWRMAWERRGQANAIDATETQARLEELFAGH